MITPLLEKLLLNGKAKNKTFHFAFGSFANLEVPKDSFVVIHTIIWNNFINQKLKDIYSKSWKDFFEYNEYTIKMQGQNTTPLQYVFRNEVDFNFVGAPGSLRLMNVNIIDAQYDDFILMQPKRPIVLNTFYTSYEDINFTLTRNALLPTNSNFAPVNNYANERPIPTGVNGQDVLLRLDLGGTNGTSEAYIPPGQKIAPGATGNFRSENYLQLYDKETPADFGSFIANPIGGFKLKHSDFVTNPLITFEYCIIQKNDGGLLSSL